MSTEMPSNVSKTFAFIGMTLASLTFAALVTLTTAATIRPCQSQNALQYVQSQRITKLIIDVDAGVDDAMAILLALAKKKPGYPEVIGITCTHGNTNQSNVIINVLKTLKVLNITMAVYPGAIFSLVNTPPGDNFFGEDGLGDVPDPSPPSLQEAEKEHAAVALVRLAREHRGKLGIIALGPLSNLAMAQRLDPEFKKNVKQVYWMGGSVEGIGNIKPGIEFNAFIDPEANYIVFNSTGPPIIILSWETCIYHGAVSKQWRQQVLGKINSPIMDFMNAIEAHSLQRSKKWSACDAKTIAVILEPTIATKAITHNVHPVYEGEARGALMVDYKDGTGEPKNAVIITNIDSERFKEMCLENFSENVRNKST